MGETNNITVGSDTKNDGLEIKVHESIVASESAKIFTLIEGLEKGLNLPSGIFKRILHEDDWSFVIKCHALLEAAATHVLVSHTDKRLKDVFSYLTAGGNAGKGAFLKALNLIDKEKKTFLKQLSKLRNDLAHDIRNVDFSFERHIDRLKLENNKLKEFKIFCAFYSRNYTPEDRSKYLNESFKEPKFNIFFGVLQILNDFYIDEMEHNISAATDEVARRKAEMLDIIRGDDPKKM